MVDENKETALDEQPGDESAAERYGELKPLDLDKFWGDIQKYGVYFDDAAVLEHLSRERYPAIQIFNRGVAESEGNDFPGEFIRVYKAGSGLSIYIYEFCIFIGVGEDAQMPGSRQGLLLATLEEVFADVLPGVGWGDSRIDFSATHRHLSDLAWVEGKRHGIALEFEEAPSQQAADIKQRVDRQISEKKRFTSQPKLQNR
ncbi:MAG: hypothetical protein JSS53_06610 [Proteobacteria bacterium]|nr:hypothetical protein [Pseudomonadota bacterium]